MRHKNKTFATLLALCLGGIGLHRFYLCGLRDSWGWLHVTSLPLCGILLSIWPDLPALFAFGPLVASALIAMIEALVIGLTPDEQWDSRMNASSGKQSNSQWPLAVLLVLTTGVGAVALIGVLARTLDLLFTGGAYG